MQIDLNDFEVRTLRSLLQTRINDDNQWVPPGHRTDYESLLRKLDQPPPKAGA